MKNKSDHIIQQSDKISINLPMCSKMITRLYYITTPHPHILRNNLVAESGEKGEIL